MEKPANIYDLAIEGGAILTMDAENPSIKDGLMLIRNGIIEFAGHRGESPQYRAEKTIRAGGKHILPPFFNQHTHLSLSLYRGLGTDLKLHDWLKHVIWPLEKAFCIPENVYLGSLLSIIEMIHGGTGALANMDFHSMAAGKALAEAGIRGFLGEGLFDGPTPSAGSPKETLNYTRELIKEFSENELISVYITPHAPFSCSPGLYEECGELGRKWNIPVCSHVSETFRENETIEAKYKLSPVGLLLRTGVFEGCFIAIHGVHLSKKDMEILAENDVAVIHNPHSNMVLGSGVCDVSGLLTYGVKVGLGTDSASSNNHLSMLREMQTAYLMHKGLNHDPAVLPAAKLLEMATMTGYQIYSMPNIGKIKKGYKADFQIIDLKSVHNQPVIEPVISMLSSMHNHDIQTLVVNGKIIMEDQRIISLDEEIILKEAAKFGKKVSAYFPHLTDNRARNIL